ncbi:hypothetical protein WN943_016463 [Citrus x changshan-huyou]
MNYGWLDPKFWERRQSQRCSHFGDDGLLEVSSDLHKSLLRWRIVENTAAVNTHPEISKSVVPLSVSPPPTGTDAVLTAPLPPRNSYLPQSTLFLLAKHSRPVTELFTVWSSSQWQPPRDGISSCLIIFLDDIQELEEGEYEEDEVEVDEDEKEENRSVHDDGEGEREVDTENYEAENDLQHRELQV